MKILKSNFKEIKKFQKNILSKFYFYDIVAMSIMNFYEFYSYYIYKLGEFILEKLVITGKTPLRGEVVISGAKNAAVALIPATLLINGICTIENLPNISDVKLYCDILKDLGAKVTWNNPNEVTIDSRNINCCKAPLEVTRKFRASYYLIGALLGRCHKAQVGIPGGCNLGQRPIDQHIKGFEALGATVEVSQGNITASAEKLVGNSIYMDVVSVGATINVMLAAVLAEGTTIIDNAAKEPHIVDVANFLNTMGADIRGAGTDVIKINGVKELKGNATYSVVPDQIEAGTFMLAAVASRGDITIKNCITKHLESITAKIIEIGAKVDANGDHLRVWCDERPHKATIKTLPYPGFPTDLQPQMGVVLSLANGTSIINESIWESRFQYTGELNKMGAQITANGKTAVFEGVEELTGAPVYASDLRAGAALIIAGVAASGTTEIYNLNHIDRGYENIEEKFKKLGAKIERVKEQED
jgi:UDP-N-acetylglucosamine 1-carboxyvinyltransferase